MANMDRGFVSAIKVNDGDQAIGDTK